MNSTLELFNQFYKDLASFECKFNSNRLISDVNKEKVLGLNINELKVNILSLCDSIADSLEEYHILSDEFLDFLEIQNMIRNVLKHDSFEEITEYEVKFLNNLLENFNKIIAKRDILTNFNSLNIENISKDKLESYKQDFDDFEYGLWEYMRDYSLNILKPEAKNETYEKLNKYMCGAIANKIIKL